MATFTLTNNLSQMSNAITRRILNLETAALIGAEGVRVDLDEILHVLYPPRVADAVDAVVDSGEESAVILARVRLVKNHPLWLWYEFGTRPHTIEPRNAQMLSFWWENMDTHFWGTIVNHPGARAHHLGGEVMRQLQPRARVRWTTSLGQAIRGEPVTG